MFPTTLQMPHILTILTAIIPQAAKSRIYHFLMLHFITIQSSNLNITNKHQNHPKSLNLILQSHHTKIQRYCMIQIPSLVATITKSEIQKEGNSRDVANVNPELSLNRSGLYIELSIFCQLPLPLSVNSANRLYEAIKETNRFHVCLWCC